jgi:DUF1009 family protein
LLCGRTKNPRVEDCLLVRLKYQDDVGSEFLMGTLDHKMGLLRIDRVDQEVVFGAAYVKLKWHHLRRTDISSLAMQSIVEKTGPKSFWKHWLL